jgi:hypothetical protein
MAAVIAQAQRLSGFFSKLGHRLYSAGIIFSSPRENFLDSRQRGFEFGSLRCSHFCRPACLRRGSKPCRRPSLKGQQGSSS